MPKTKTFTKGKDTYIVCPKCGAIYNANETEHCPGCLYGLKLNYSPKKKKKKKLTPEQLERQRKYQREYAKKRRKAIKLLWTMPSNGGLDNDEQMW